MKKLEKNGGNISADLPTEVSNISPHGFWLLADNRELYLDFTNFPWFKKATVEQICTVDQPAPNHFHWPLLDIDLDLDRIIHPEKFPLVAKANT